MPTYLVDPTFAILAALALFCLAAVFFRQEAWLSFKIIVQFLFIIALPILLLISSPLWVLSQVSQLSPQVWQALVAGVVLVTGWLTTTIFGELGRRRDRQEKTRDYHRAIFSEIGNNLVNIDQQADIKAHAEEIITRMRSDDGFVPFIPLESNDSLYTTLSPEIQILPRKTIDPIVAYYSQIRSIAALVEDMRSEDFRKMSQEGRIAMYSDYIDMKLQAYAFGDHALVEIDIYENGSIKAARRAKRRLNNRGEVPSDRSQG